MKKISQHFLLTLLLSFTAISAAGDDSKPVAKAFAQLKTLVGNWKRQDANNTDFKIRFELTANETVLVETWLYENKKHSITVYHRDGDNLLATHYCPQGNQPRLQMSQVGTSNDIVFEFRDATNLDSLRDSHQHSLHFILRDKNTSITRAETYRSEKGNETTALILERIDAVSASEQPR